jgi:hypothetical protein
MHRPAGGQHQEKHMDGVQLPLINFNSVYRCMASCAPLCGKYQLTGLYMHEGDALWAVVCKLSALPLQTTGRAWPLP